MGRFHATIVSDKSVDTVNFYEDFLGFVTTIEKDGYALLQKQDDPDLCIAVFDSTHPCVEDLASVQGLMLTLTMPDVKGFYDHLYMEGLEFFKDYSTDIIHGGQHFVVYDPNGVLINVREPLDMRELIAA